MVSSSEIDVLPVIGVNSSENVARGTAIAARDEMKLSEMVDWRATELLQGSSDRK